MFKPGAIGVFAGAMCATIAVWAEPLDPVYLERYGGTYSTNCDDVQGERLSVFEDRLLLANGDREWVAEDILSDVYYWGRMPPDNFEIALMAGSEPDTTLVFLVHSGKQRLYILLEEHPDRTTNTGADSGEENRYFKCES
jgi:hypothetical protein